MAKSKNPKPIPLNILRKARGISQKDLADALNVSNGLIGLYETGKRKPSLDKALSIASYFDTSVERIQFDCRSSK